MASNFIVELNKEIEEKRQLLSNADSVIKYYGLKKANIHDITGFVLGCIWLIKKGSLINNGTILKINTHLLGDGSIFDTPLYEAEGIFYSINQADTLFLSQQYKVGDVITSNNSDTVAHLIKVFIKNKFEAYLKN